jgi:hypothetical protein
MRTFMRTSVADSEAPRKPKSPGRVCHASRLRRDMRAGSECEAGASVTKHGPKREPASEGDIMRASPADFGAQTVRVRRSHPGGLMLEPPASK